MSTGNEQQHKAKIVEQFSQQAIPFTKVPGHGDAIQTLIQMAGVSAADSVLDVACGPGMVACEFARHAAKVTGVDLTPAMIDEAKRRQKELGLENLSWQVGDAVPLPFDDDTFSIVITRYSFHHLLDPQQALNEMIRVCRPGGRILVADVAMPVEKAAAYDRLEIMRDPSHTHALTHEEFDALFAASGLTDCSKSAYGVDIGLEQQLKASFPTPGDEAKLREMVTSDVGKDLLGINARKSDGKIVYTVPISVYVGRKA